MNININCPVCDYQAISGNTCPNCDTNLSTIRLLQELPQIQAQRKAVKLGLSPLIIIFFILLIGILLGSFTSNIFFQTQLKLAFVSYDSPFISHIFS